MAHHSLCGVLRRDGRDCPVPVEPGSPFNVCPHHYQAISQYLSDARSAAGGSHRLSIRCPACGVAALLAEVATQTATCASCGHHLDAEQARELNGFGSGFRALPRPATPPATSVVYYLRFGDRIKIGTTIDLPKRLLALPYDELLLTEPGSYELEKRRHQQFNRHLIAGREWFEAHPDLLAFIEESRCT